MAIKFKPNYPKTLEIILWLANREPKKGIDLYRLLKILFWADKWHLNRYGRPIAGDRYVAMPYGPVAEVAYDILRKNARSRQTLKTEEFPFQTFSTKAPRVFATRQPNMSVFSKSDITALTWAFEKYGHMDFNELKRRTHRQRAYKAAWERRGDRNSYPIDYSDFLDRRKDVESVIEELEYTSQFM